MIKPGSQVQNNLISIEITLSKWTLELYYPNARYYLETFGIIRTYTFMSSTKILSTSARCLVVNVFLELGETAKPINKWCTFCGLPRASYCLSQ